MRSMSENVSEAPDPDSDEFLQHQDTVEKVSPGTTADAPGTDAGLISTDPTPSDAGPDED